MAARHHFTAYARGFSGPRTRDIYVTLSESEFACLEALVLRDGTSRMATVRAALALYRFARDPAIIAAVREAERR